VHNGDELCARWRGFIRLEPCFNFENVTLWRNVDIAIGKGEGLYVPYAVTYGIVMAVMNDGIMCCLIRSVAHLEMNLIRSVAHLEMK
jgi:hypothetical protein